MPLDVLGFDPVKRGRQRYWRAPQDFGFVERLGLVPVAETELLNVSHHLPLLVLLQRTRTVVVAVVAPAALRQPLVDREGRWLRSYMPVALRALPFRLQVPDTGELDRSALLMAETIGIVPPEHGAPLFESDGSLTKQVADVSAMLMRSQMSQKKLDRAAELLLLAGLLAPVDLQLDSEADVYAVDPSRLPGFTNRHVVAAIREGYLPMHLLSALLFSRRLMSPRVQQSSSDTPPGPGRLETIEDFAFSSLAPLNFALDDSDLVPVDLFE